MLPFQLASNRNLLQIIFYSLIFYFFLRLLVDFVEAVYAFGLFGSNIPPEIISVLLFMSPLVLSIIPKGLSRGAVLVFGVMVLLSGALEVFLDTRGQMLLSGVGLACALILIPALIKHQAAENTPFAMNMTAGLALGLSLEICFYVINSGVNITVDGEWRWLGLILAILAGFLLPLVISPDATAISTRESKNNTLNIIGLSVGIMAAFILLFYAFVNPGVIARWTNRNYLAIVSGALLALFTCASLMAFSRKFIKLIGPEFILVWNVLFLFAIVITAWSYQIAFPANPDHYPLYEPAPTAIADISLGLMIALFPVILVDFLLFTRQLAKTRPSWRALGAGFGLGGFFLLLMVFAHVFTTVYDYIPVIGPAFRDRFWLVHLVAGLALVLPILLVDKESYHLVSAMAEYKLRWPLPAVIALIAIVSVIGILLVSAKPAPVASENVSLKVLTYNVQQGYSEADQRNFDGQLGLIRSKDPDILGLQESDSTRIANGNTDLVRYYADQLNMYSYYGPKTVTGTFGVALLSKYPIENPRIFFMYSQGEQTAAIVARISVNGKTYSVYVTHLGNGGPIFQQEAILKDLTGRQNVILMGDFNFRPDTAQYRLTTQTLLDAWLTRWPAGVEDNGLVPKQRIDHFFLTPDIKIRDVRFLVEPQSDHPAVYLEIQP